MQVILVDCGNLKEIQIKFVAGDSHLRNCPKQVGLTNKNSQQKSFGYIYKLTLH